MLLKTGVVVPIASIRKVLQPVRNIPLISQETAISSGYSMLALTFTFHLRQLRHILCVNGFHKIRDTSEDEITLLKTFYVTGTNEFYTHSIRVWLLVAVIVYLLQSPC